MDIHSYMWIYADIRRYMWMYTNIHGYMWILVYMDICIDMWICLESLERNVS